MKTNNIITATFIVLLLAEILQLIKIFYEKRNYSIRMVNANLGNFYRGDYPYILILQTA